MRPSIRLLPLLWVVLALAAVAATWVEPARWAHPYDWRYFESLLEVARRTVSWYGQMPLWNPYQCGGEVLLANPQSELASPTFLFSLVFGTAVGIKLSLWVYWFCAFDGGFRLAKSHGLSTVASMLAAILYGGTGWLALHVASGHSNFASAALFPYLLLFYRRALDEWEWAIPMGAIAAWIVALGGTSTPAMAAVLLATVATMDAVSRRSAKPYLVLVLGAAAALAIGAVRILPATEFAFAHPRQAWETDANNIWQILVNGFRWQNLSPVAGKRYWFHEYCWRMSFVVIPLAIWSIRAKVATRRYWVLAVVAGSIVAGAAIPYGPWWMLKHLPMYRDLRVPSRYSILLVLAVSLLAAGAFDDLLARLKSARWRMVLTVVVLVGAAGECLAFDWFCFRNVFTMKTHVALEGTPFYQEQGEWRVMMDHILAGHGAIGCDEEAPLQRALQLDIGPNQPQAKLAPNAAGVLGQLVWTPNRLEIAVDLPSPARVLFNQNWNEHWKTSAGLVVRDGPKVARDRDGGRLAVDAPAGKYTLVLRYRPTSFVVGAATSAIGIPGLLALFVVRRRRRSAARAQSTPASHQ